MDNITIFCPGCKRVRIGGKWQEGMPPPDSTASPQICVDCRNDKAVVAELLNDGFVPEPAR